MDEDIQEEERRQGSMEEFLQRCNAMPDMEYAGAIRGLMEASLPSMMSHPTLQQASSAIHTRKLKIFLHVQNMPI